MLKPTNAMVFLCYLVHPGLVFAECPWSIGSPCVGWTDPLLNHMTDQMDRAYMPIFVCLMVVLCVVAAFDTDTDGIQPGRDKSQNPEHRTAASLNHPHRKGIV